MKQNLSRLYNYLQSLGPCMGEAFHIIDNSGPNADAPAYLVHLSGGVFFEIVPDVEKSDFFFRVIWQGILPDDDPALVMGLMRVLGHNI